MDAWATLSKSAYELRASENTVNSDRRTPREGDRSSRPPWRLVGVSWIVLSLSPKGRSNDWPRLRIHR